MSSKSFKIIIHCYNTFCCKGEFVCLVFVIGLPQAKLTIFPTFAIDEEKVQMVCGGHEAISECMFYPAGQENLLKPSDSCNFSITGANLIAWSQDNESHVNISCYYTVHASRQNESSPHSERVSIRVRGTLFNHKLFARQINCFLLLLFKAAVFVSCKVCPPCRLCHQSQRAAQLEWPPMEPFKVGIIMTVPYLII